MEKQERKAIIDKMIEEVKAGRSASVPFQLSGAEQKRFDKEAKGKKK